MSTGHADPIILLDGLLGRLNCHYRRHITNGDLGPREVQQTPNTLDGFNDGRLLVGLDVDPSLGLSGDRAGNSQRSALPGVGGTLVHDLVHHFLLLPVGALDHEQTRIRHGRYQGLLRHGAVILRAANPPRPAVQDRPIHPIALHPMPLLDLPRHFGNVRLGQVPSPRLSTAPILQPNQLLGLLVELLLPYILLGVMTTDDVVGIVMSAVRLPPLLIFLVIVRRFGLLVEEGIARGLLLGSSAAAAAA
mmetsp:Transcript_8832/g.18965  ORF Transcript_8832/g.18965 Transcript_8832/m.18965 type:complete len:248 (-) Transcript_8832:317-1060(-)